MAIVTVDEFKLYAKKISGDSALEDLYEVFVNSAEAVVTDFLGYDPTSQTYTNETHYGDGRSYVCLKARPISALSAFSVDGVAEDVLDYTIDDDRIIRIDGTEFYPGATLSVSYTAGYSTVPDLIKQTVLRIAALLSVEAGENIGVTSQSFDGGNTRSFLNYTNFDKYLAPIARYRLVRLPRLVP